MTIPEQTQPAVQASRSRCFGCYLALLFVVPVLLLLGVFALANTRWFFYHDNYFALREIGYSLTLEHADCQVILYGDSSALTGLDPQTVTRLTGLSACNVSEGGTITVVTGNYPLDAYLKKNAPPKYIVFMYTPSIFKPSHGWRDYGSYIEGIIYLLQYERGLHTDVQMLKHPRETATFLTWAAHSMWSDAVTRLTNPHKYDGFEDPQLRRQRHGGLFTYYAEPETKCWRNGWDMRLKITTDPDWVAGLRGKYGVNGTKVFVNVAPVADCDDMKAVYQQVLQGIPDNMLDVLPIHMFNNEDVHFTPEGAERVSTGVARQILADERAGKP